MRHGLSYILSAFNILRWPKKWELWQRDRSRQPLRSMKTVTSELACDRPPGQIHAILGGEGLRLWAIWLIGPVTDVPASEHYHLRDLSGTKFNLFIHPFFVYIFRVDDAKKYKLKSVHIRAGLIPAKRWIKLVLRENPGLTSLRVIRLSQHNWQYIDSFSRFAQLQQLIILC